MSTTTSRNEAAERLAGVIGSQHQIASRIQIAMLNTMGEALAIERRATVERIVDAIPTLEWIVLPDSIIDPFRAEGWPFDEEAAQ